MIRTLETLTIHPGTRVLLRVDWNIPLAKGRVDRTEEYKIERSLKTLRWLRSKKAVVIAFTHLGRPPKPTYTAEFSTRRLLPSLRRTADFPIRYCPEKIGSTALALAIDAAKPGSVLLLENVRFYPGEEKDDIQFANQLASLADVYVNDAFASYRPHASIHKVAQLLPSAAGFLFEEEVKHLEKLLEQKTHPYLVILGGAKISTKLGVIRHLAPLADAMVLGGGIGNTIMACRGFSIGASLAEDVSGSAVCHNLVPKKCEEKIILPKDVVVAETLKSKKARVVPAADVQPDDVIGDIGPATIKDLTAVIARAKVVVWNGPVGYFENPGFAKGSLALARAIAKSKAFSVVGGGETIQLIRKSGLEKKFSFLSTGGGAMVEFLEGKKLPAVEVLSIRH